MAKKTPHITVTERDVQAPLDVLLSDPRYRDRIKNPFGQRSEPIGLKDKSRVARWINEEVGVDHVWRCKQNGWDPVTPAEIVDIDQIGGHNVSVSGFVVRGERGKEHLVSIPIVVRDAVQAAKTEYNRRHMGNPNAMKNEVVEAAGRAIGSEAADFLNQHTGPIGGVTDSYERVERQVEPE